MLGKTADSGPLSQRSTHAQQYAETKTNTNRNPDPNRYRRRCPDPNARIQEIAAICDSGLSPDCMVLEFDLKKKAAHRVGNNKQVLGLSNY